MPVDSFRPETPVDKEVDVYTPTERKPLTSGVLHPFMPSRKEQTLGNTTRHDTNIFTLWNNLSTYLREMGLDDVAEMYEYELYWRMNAQRSEGGFERKEQGKMKQEMSGSIDYQGQAPTNVIIPK